MTTAPGAGILSFVQQGLDGVSPGQLSGQDWVASRPAAVAVAAAADLLGRLGRVLAVLDGQPGQFARVPGAALASVTRVGEQELLHRLLGSPLVRVAAMYRDLRGDLVEHDVLLRELFNINEVTPISALPAGPRLTVALLNPQGNFDTPNTGLGDHADFGGQLIYVRELAISLAKLGMLVQIVTRRIDADPRFPKWGDRFAGEVDVYRDENDNEVPGVSIIRVQAGPAGPQMFLEKEKLWEYLDGWTNEFLDYNRSLNSPAMATLGHYADGGFAGALLKLKASMPMVTWTMHSGGDGKLAPLATRTVQAETSLTPVLADSRIAPFNFSQRVTGERLAMTVAERIVVSTAQEKNEQYSTPVYAGPDLTIGAKSLDIQIIPPGINTQIFRTENTGSLIEQQTHAALTAALTAQISPTRTRLAQIIVAARLNPKKNVVRMVEMFATSARLQERANLVLMLTGGPNAFIDPQSHFKPGSEELMVATQVADLLKNPAHDLAGKVLVPGLANTQLEWAATARFPATQAVPGVFLHGALEEPFGLMLLEAGVSGLAVAATNVGGPVESLEHGRSGNLFNPHSIPEMEAAVWDLVGQWDGANFPARWQELHRNVIDRVQSTYSWDAAGREYAKLIFPGLGLAVPPWLAQQTAGHSLHPLSPPAPTPVVPAAPDRSPSTEFAKDSPPTLSLRSSSNWLVSGPSSTSQINLPGPSDSASQGSGLGWTRSRSTSAGAVLALAPSTIAEPQNVVAPDPSRGPANLSDLAPEPAASPREIDQEQPSPWLDLDASLMGSADPADSRELSGPGPVAESQQRPTPTTTTPGWLARFGGWFCSCFAPAAQPEASFGPNRAPDRPSRRVPPAAIELAVLPSAPQPEVAPRPISPVAPPAELPQLAPPTEFSGSFPGAADPAAQPEPPPTATWGQRVAAWNPIFDAPESDSAAVPSTSETGAALLLDESDDVEQEIRQDLQLAVSRELVAQLQELRRLILAADPQASPTLLAEIAALSEETPNLSTELHDGVEQVVMLAVFPNADEATVVRITELGRTSLSLMEQVVGLQQNFIPNLERALDWVEAGVATGARGPAHRAPVITALADLQLRAERDYSRFATSAGWSHNGPADPDLLPATAQELFDQDSDAQRTAASASAEVTAALTSTWLEMVDHAVPATLAEQGPARLQEIVELSGQALGLEFDRSSERIASLAEGLRLAYQEQSAWDARVAALPREGMRVFAFIAPGQQLPFSEQDWRNAVHELHDLQTDRDALRRRYNRLVERYQGVDDHRYRPHREEIRELRRQLAEQAPLIEAARQERRVLAEQLALLGNSPRRVEELLQHDLSRHELWLASGFGQALLPEYAEALDRYRAAGAAPTEMSWSALSAQLDQLSGRLDQLIGALRRQEQRTMRQLAQIQDLRDRSRRLNQVGTAHHALYEFRFDLAQNQHMLASARYRQALDELANLELHQQVARQLARIASRASG